MKTPSPLSVFLAALILALSARAELKLPAIFSDHMVLQRDAVVPVWGTADAGAVITVEFAGQKKSATAAPDGRWRVDLDPLGASAAPRELSVSASRESKIENQKLADVLIGEVWLGSGQSNMAMMVSRSKDYETEQVAAKFPLVRQFKEESGSAATAQTSGKGRWVLCAPETVGAFSATLYFFGREVHQTLGVPVGLINSSVGGTPIESWIAPEAQRASAELKPFFDLPPPAPAAAAPKKAQTEKQNAAAVKKAAARPADLGGLFNGKIAPLIPYAIRGALWYQGEANSTPAKAPFYAAQLALLVRDWRARWGAELPFAWVQLPNFTGAGRDWPTVREAMLQTLALPRTGMAIAIDVGEAGDIHPKNKQAVGHRLALWALGEVYGQKIPATSGPLPAGHTVRGHEIVLRFTHADGGLVATGSGALTGFQIAGADGKFTPATARIVGDTVVVSSPAVAAPVAARYAWENLPTCNLANAAGLPASPFRTDTGK